VHNLILLQVIDGSPGLNPDLTESIVLFNFKPVFCMSHISVVLWQYINQ